MSDPRSPDAGADRQNPAASPAGQATVPGPVDPPQPDPPSPLVDPVPPVDPPPTVEPVPPVDPRPSIDPNPPLEPPPTLDSPPLVDPPPPLVDPVPSQPVTSAPSSPSTSPTADPMVVEPVPPPPPDAPATPAGPPWKAIAAVLGVLVIALIAYLLLSRDDDDDDEAGGGTTTTLASDEFVPVQDEAAGFTVEYPKSWQTIRPAEGEERLLLTVGGESYFQVKVRTVDPATVNQEIQTALSGLRMITEPRQLTLNGLPATLYLYYTPVTESSPQEGVHVHYFILKADKLYTMVFQAMPAEALNDLVPVFDRVAKSFNVIDTPSTQETAPTTAAPR